MKILYEAGCKCVMLIGMLLSYSIKSRLKHKVYLKRFERIMNVEKNE